MEHSIYIEKEQLIEEAKKKNKTSYFFIESYLDFLSNKESAISFLDVLKVNNTTLSSVYSSYCQTQNKELRAYLLSLPRIKYNEIENLIQPNAFDLKTYEGHSWNQAGYGFFVNELDINKYSKFSQLIYSLFLENNESVFQIEKFLKENNILNNSFNQDLYHLFELNFIKK